MSEKRRHEENLPKPPVNPKAEAGVSHVSPSKPKPRSPIPDGDTHILAPGSLNLPKKETPPHVDTTRIPRRTDKPRPEDPVEEEAKDMRNKTADALKKIARSAPPTPSRGIPRKKTPLPPKSGKIARPSGRLQKPPSERYIRPSERLRRPNNKPQALSAEQFREKTAKLSLEGPSKELVEGAIHIISIGEAVLEKALIQGDTERTKEYATRLAKTALLIDNIFRERLTNSETWEKLTDDQRQVDLMKITKPLIASPSTDLIEDIIYSFKNPESESWGVNEKDIEQLNRCFSDLLHFSFESVRFMKKRSENNIFENLHQKALEESSRMLSFMMSIPPHEKDEAYNQRIQERTDIKIIREFNILILTALLQHSPNLDPPITELRELGIALGEIIEIKEWCDVQGKKLLAFMRSEKLTNEDRILFLRAIIGIAKEEDFRELIWDALSDRDFIGLALRMKKGTDSTSPKNSLEHPEIDESHIRHVISRTEQKLISQGNIDSERKRMYPLPQTREVYPETEELFIAIEKTKQAQKRIKEQAKLLPSAAQGPQFNPLLELRNRAVAVLREQISNGNIPHLTDSTRAIVKAEEILSKYEELTKKTTKKAYDPTNKKHIDSVKTIPNEDLQTQRKTLVEKLKQLHEACNKYVDEVIIPECETNSKDLQEIKAAFPPERPLSTSLSENLQAVLEKTSNSPVQQEGTIQEFRFENFTVPCLHSRGPLGIIEGQRAYGIIYTANKRSINDDGNREETPVALIRCYIHEKYLPALQKEINGNTDKASGAPTSLYVVKNPLESFGFAAKSVFVEYPGETALPPHDAKGRFLTAAHLRIETFLARGGFGMVYKGRNTRGEAIVAKAGLEPKHDIILEREHEIGTTLKHPSIATSSRLHIISDPLAMYGIPRGRKLIEMPFAEGIDPLEFCLEEAKEAGIDTEHKGQYILWATEMVVEIGLKLLDALQHAHEKNIAHLDIKPDNLRITRDQNGRLVLSLFDLGAARHIGETSMESSLPFSAPETCEVIIPKDPTADIEIKEYIATPRVDIFSVGATLGSLLLQKSELWGIEELMESGPQDIKTLFDNGIFATALRAKKTINPFDHERLKEDRTIKEKTIMFSKGHPTELLLRILRKATHPDPLNRIQEVGEFKLALETIKGLTIEKAREDAEREEKRKRAITDRKQRVKKEAKDEKAEEIAKKDAERETIRRIREGLEQEKARRTSSGSYSRSEVLGTNPVNRSPEKKEVSPKAPSNDGEKPKIVRGFDAWHKSGSSAMKVDLEELRKRSTLHPENPKEEKEEE